MPFRLLYHPDASHASQQELEKRYASQQVFKNYHNLLKKYGHHVKRITFIGLGVDNGHVLYCLSLAPQVDSVNLHCINTPATPFSGFDPEPACPLASSSKWTFNPDDLSVHLKKIHVDTCMVIVPEWNTFLNRLAPQLEELVIEDELTGIPIMDLFAISPLTQHVADTAALPAIWPRLRTLRLLSSHVYINTYSLTKIPPHSICGLRSLERFEIYLTRADSPIVLQQVLDASRHCLRELTVYAERKDRYLTVVSITEIRPCPAYGPYGPWCCPPTMAKCEVLESLHLTVTPRPDHRTATFLETIPAHMPTLKLDFIVPDSDAMYALKYILSVPVYLGHNPEHLDFDGRLAQALQRLKVDRLELSIRAPLEVSQGEMLLGTTILQFSRFPFSGVSLDALRLGRVADF